MTRVERLKMTRLLLDDSRLSALDISKIVSRSPTWVKQIARQYPRSRTIRTIYPPTPVRNAATPRDDPPRPARSVRRRSRRSVYPNKYWCWFDRIAGLGYLGLLIFGVWHGDLVVREGERRLTYQARRAPPEGGGVP